MKFQAIMTFRVILFAVCALILFGCSTEQETRFQLLSPDQTGIDFQNDLTSTRDFNIVNYMYFYDGAGVAAGDINNDGLTDLFFVGNEVPNRLYLNRGDFNFEDVTESAGIADDSTAWSTGVTMADVTGNGYLDIYVSRVNYLNKSGPNQFYVNNGDGTFTERAEEFGIDFEGYSTQAAFLDYNNSGRLDLFILNQSFHSERSYGQADLLRNEIDPKAGDRLFRNDGDTFTDVTEEAGIYSSSLGYGLGVAVSDIDLDGDPDIYVGNDFHEKDYLYLNNGDGTFTESLYEFIGHTSNASMGNDVADVTNDGYPEIISLDMMPDNHESFLRSGGPDLVVVEETKKNFGFGNKNARNTMQIHRGLTPDGEPFFSEMAFTLGIARTDWSWASLLADFDNSGTKDLYATNGMVHRPNDLDYIRMVGNFRDRSTGDRTSVEEFESIQSMPTIFTANYMYRNDGDLQFSDATIDWGFSQQSYSSGAVYADLNNDGMLDIVVSNVNMPPFIYQNRAVQDSSSNYLKVRLVGSEMNRTGLGTKVLGYAGGEKFYVEQMPTRGFQSSVDPVLHLGLGEFSVLDSLLVIWPDGQHQTVENISANQEVELLYSESGGAFNYDRLHRSYNNAMFSRVEDLLPPGLMHAENEYSDFSQEPLIPYYLSSEGPAVAVGDVTGNGLDDIYIGSAHREAPKLFLQQEAGRFRQSSVEQFESEALYEDVDALFFDANGDGHLDLYVVSGGGQLFQSGAAHRDRLYINDGNGEFTKSSDSLPDLQVNGSTVTAEDFDGDGDMDLFVGGRSMPWNYGQSPEHAILENDGSGNFQNVTADLAPELQSIGMVTDAVWVDYTGNGRSDLIVVGEWMPVSIFENRGDSFADITSEIGLDQYSGMWQSIEATDLDGDGSIDLIAGNFGTNSRMEASSERPVSLVIKDFNDNGYTSGLVTIKSDGKEKPFEQLDELIQEFPQLPQRVDSYEDFAGKSITEILGDNALVCAERKSITELQSVVIFNRGASGAEIVPLPVDAQSFPVKAIHMLDANSTQKDLLLVGNHYGVKPSYGGRQDAGYGLHVRYTPAEGFRTLTHQESGFYVEGDARTINSVQINGEIFILVGVNDHEPFLFQTN
jgi:hypothetical protein